LGLVLASHGAALLVSFHIAAIAAAGAALAAGACAFFWVKPALVEP